MKKQKKSLLNIFLVFATVVVMGLSFLPGCSKAFSFDGKFDKSELIMCVGETFDPSEHFSSDKKVEFSVPEQQVITLQEDGLIKAQMPGKSFVLATSGKLLIGKMDVYVKYSFPVPTNIRVDSDGLITWDEAELLLDGETKKPTYSLQITLDGEPQEMVQVQTNQYQLTQSGNYEVTVKANESADGRILGSEFNSTPISFGFDFVTGVSDFVFNSEDEFGSQKGLLTWQGEGDFVLTLGNMEYELNKNSEQLDFSLYAEQEVLQAKVLRKEEGKLSKSSKIDIKKLKTPVPKFVENELVWGKDDACKYLLKATNQQTEKIVSVTGEKSVLEGLGEGIYSVQMQAIGKPNFANSNVAKYASLLGKIDNVEVQYEIVGSNLNVTFSTAKENNKSFVVTQYAVIDGENVLVGSETFTFEGGKTGDKYVLNHSFPLENGKNSFEVQALPSVSAMVLDGESTSRILKSDILKFDAYNLSEITNLHHSLSGDEHDISALTFDEIEYAEKYTVEVNGEKLEKVDSSTKDGKTTLTLGRLTKAMGKEGKYNIKITVDRVQKEGEITRAVTNDEKTLTMLKVPVMQALNGNKLENSKYVWEKVIDAASDIDVANYKYELYLTEDDGYDNSLVVADVKDTEENQTSELKAGYYVLRVKSLPKPEAEDDYLPSEDFAEDKFYYAEVLESAGIRLDKAEDIETTEIVDGYILTIQAVEDGYKYEVFVNDLSVGSVLNADKKDVLYYELGKDYLFKMAEENFKIEVKVSATDETQQRIHLESLPSVLNVSRLTAPTKRLVDGEKLTVENKDNSASLELVKDGKRINELTIGGNVTIDMSDYEGEFDINARLQGYQNFEDFTTNGTIRLDSDFHAFKFHRSQTPSELNYSKGQISFEHNDQVTEYVALVSVKSLNNEISEKEIVLSTTEKTFDLEEKLVLLRADELFESAYLQRKTLTIKVFARISKDMADVYYLSSRYATLKQSADKNALEIKKLGEVSLLYDEEGKFIYWEGLDAFNVVYEVYYISGEKDEKKGEVKENKFSINSDEYNFSQAGEYKFYVIARSDNSLKSEPSKQIIFHKLKPVESVNVFERDGDYWATFTLNENLTGHITKVWVNGVNIAGDYPQRITFEFKLDKDSFEVYVEGENHLENGDRIHYISSDKKIFAIKDISSSQFDPEIKIENEAIVWKDFGLEASDWMLAQPQKSIAYNLKITNSTQTITIENIKENKLSLLDERLVNASKGILSGDCTISLTVLISEYSLQAGGSGYYGKVDLNGTCVVGKLGAVTNAKAVLNEGGSFSTIEAEYQKDIILSWERQRQNGEMFEIYLNGKKLDETENNSFTVKQSALAESGTNIIEIYVYDKKNLRSDAARISVYRFNEVKVSSFDDDGKIQIAQDSEYDAAKGYIVGIKLGDEEKFFNIENSSFNVQDYLGDFKVKDGVCGLRIIHRATDKITLPNIKATYIEKIMLKKPSVTQTATGLSISTAEADCEVVVKCEVKEFEKTLPYSASGMFLQYPETWDSGEYQFVIYAKKEGCLNSYIKDTSNFTINRIDNVGTVKFTRTENGLDYTLSWNSVSDADHYEIEVWKADESLYKASVNSNQILLSELRKWAEEDYSGEYRFRFTTFAQTSKTANTISKYMEFSVTVVPNAIEDITVSQMGELMLTSSEPNASFHIVAQDGLNKSLSWDKSGQEMKIVVKDESEEKIVLSGLINVSVVQKGGQADEQEAKEGSAIMLDSIAKQNNFSKLQNISSINKNEETGDIKITVKQEDFPDRQFYIVANIAGVTQIKKTPYIKESATLFKIRSIEICELFPELEEGTFKFNIFSTAESVLRSEEIDCSFEYGKISDVLSLRKVDENDFLIINKQWQENSSLPHTGEADGNITKIYVYVISQKGEKYLDIDVSKAKGYWMESDPWFMTTIPSVKEYQKVYALNMADVLAELDAGKIYVKIGYVQSQFAVYGFSEAFEYQKLEAPQNVSAQLGNVTWEATSDFATAYKLYFENEAGTSIAKQSSTLPTVYLGEEIEKSGDFYIAVQAVSSNERVVSSSKVYYQKEKENALVHKLAGVTTKAHIKEGVITLDFDGDENGELENLEKKYKEVQASSVNQEEAVKHLMTDRLLYPFDYSLQDLSTLKLNLKFVSKDSGTTGERVFTTTVNATDILSRLKQSMFETLQKALGTYSSPEFLTFNNILASKTNFLGVASSSLAFDEIGSEESKKFGFVFGDVIPSGKYDIYIQQQGTDETFSSSYKLILENKQITRAPKTWVTAVAKEEGSPYQNYYLNFQPVDDYSSYTLKFGERQAVVYTITKEGDRWFRTSFNGEKVELEKGNDANGNLIVKISLNDPEKGIRYESDKMKYIYDVNPYPGRSEEMVDDEVIFTDLQANIYVNGDGGSSGEGNIINGKSDAIYCHFLNFQYNSLKMTDGYFNWSNDSARPTLIYYKTATYTRQDTIFGKNPNWSPNNVGLYETIQFATIGAVEETKLAVWVDSPIYRIHNVYKLEGPTLDAVDGEIRITAGNNSQYDKRTNFEFILSNDVSERATSNRTKTIYTTQNIIMHKTGVNEMLSSDEGYRYAETERNAQVFYVALSGHTVREYSADRVDYMTFSFSGSRDDFEISVNNLEDGGSLLLQSNKSKLDAQKLTYQKDDLKAEVKKGNISWENQNAWEEVANSLQEGQKLIFQVEVVFLTNINVGGTNGWEETGDRQVFYTESPELNAELIDVKLADVNYAYVINILPRVYTSVVSQGAVNSIKTLEGNTYYVLAANSTYKDGAALTNKNEVKILNGELLQLGSQQKPVERSSAITIEDFGIQKGRLAWSEAADDKNVKYLLYKYDGANKILLEGDVSSSDGKTYFNPDPTNATQLESGKTYNFAISVYEEAGENTLGKLRSPVTNLVDARGDFINVGMLPVITNQDYLTNRDTSSEQNEYPHTIDFTTYFTRIKVLTNGDVTIWLEITKGGNIKDGQNRVSQLSPSAEFMCDLDAPETIITARAEVDNANMLNPYTSSQFSFDELSWNGADGFYFDSESQIFYWTFGATIKNRTTADAKVYVNELGKPMGVDKGETLTLADEYLPVTMDDETLYVAIKDVKIILEDKTLMVTTKDGGSVALYKDNMGEAEADGKMLTGAATLPLNIQSWKIKKSLPIFSEETYYLPLSAVNIDVQTGVLTAKEDFVLFTDAACEKPISIAKGTLLDSLQSTSEGEYWKTEYAFADKAPYTIYLKTDEADRIYEQDYSEEQCQGVFFKVVTETSYSYTDPRDSRIKIDVTTERTYNNVPIGEKTTGEFNGIKIDENGIYVTSFEPNVSGQIQKFTVQSRKGENNLLSDIRPEQFTQTQFNLFGDYGEGNLEHPYIISSATEFENMKYRQVRQPYLKNYHEKRTTKRTNKNTGNSQPATTTESEVVEEEDSYYFVQQQDFELNATGFKQTLFKGNYDGDNHKITIKLTGHDDLLAPVTGSVAVGTSSGGGKTEREFTKGGGLFEQLDANAEIKNLTIDFRYTFTSSGLDKENVLIGGLVNTNYGKISGIKVISSQVTFNSKIPSSLLLAPVVAQNNGTVEDVSSSANVNITNTFSGGVQNFYYSGLVGFNNSRTGAITFARNTGSISVNFVNNLNGSVNVGGVAISSVEQSSIQASLNSGNLTATCVNGSAVAGGVCVYCENSDFYHNVNTGTISAQHAGGVMFYFRGAKFGGLVAFGAVRLPSSSSTNSNLIAINTSQGTADTTSYSVAGYRPSSSNWKCNAMEEGELDIQTKDGKYKIHLTRQANSYTADITKS